MPEVQKRVLEFIDKNEGLLFGEENPQKIAKWENTLQRLKEKIQSPMTSEKNQEASFRADEAWRN